MNPSLYRALILSTLLVTLLRPGLSSAQHTADQQHGTAMPATTAAVGSLPWAEAQVRRIDTAAGKISLRHGEIKNLDMPPMTMVFQVQDPTQLQALSVGDKVRFTADQLLGTYTVLQIEKQP